MLLVGHAKLAWMAAGAFYGSSTTTSSRLLTHKICSTDFNSSEKNRQHQRSYYTTLNLASTTIASSADQWSNGDNVNDEASLGAARAMLFDDQHRAMGSQAEQEALLLDPNMKEMQQVDIINTNTKNKNKNKRNKKQRQRKKSAGMGFGSSTPSSAAVSSAVSSSSSVVQKFDEKTEILAAAVEEDGVVLVPSVLNKEITAQLRECLMKENEVMRDMIRADPSKSISLFYVPADIHFSTLRGYVLLPFRDSESVANGNNVGTLVQATRELLAPEAPLSNLFGRMCDGLDSQLYDFCALRTEPGAARQVVHSDTPHQDIPGLFCAFVALQDVTMAMGGTMFIPKTHKRTSPERIRFDSGDTNGMLQAAQPQYTMLKAGDAAFFDMRTLHAGLPNLPAEEGGAKRLLMAVTFRNLNAKEALGHKPNIRPGYAGLFTLGGFQEELAKEAPFANIGDGLLH